MSFYSKMNNYQKFTGPRFQPLFVWAYNMEEYLYNVSNIQLSQMPVFLAACCKLAVDHNTLQEVLYVF